jgi:predicted dehydrogenase
LIGVLGSGFGLYGHIPALVELGYPVKTLARYQTVLDSRSELAALRSKLKFVETEAEVLAQTVAIVLARRPQDNVQQAISLRTTSASLPTLVMEKPLASTPQGAASLLQEFAGAQVRTPFLLRWCNWTPALQRVLGSGGKRLAIEWGYSPSGPPSRWKANHMAGGGMLGFYFIHVIAFITFLFPQFTISRFFVEADDAGTRLELEVVAGNQAARVSFEAGGARNFFRTVVDDQVIESADTPFGPTPRAGVRDPRIDVLKRFYAQEVFGLAPPSEQARIVALWTELRRRADSFPAPASNFTI